MDCSIFVARVSDYVDRTAPYEDLQEMEKHLARCGSCRRYARVIERGAELVRSLPQPPLRDDFEPRLRHRLYHVQEERAFPEQVASRAPALTVLGIALLLTAIAWSPVLRGAAPVVQLDPIVVSRAPARETGGPLAWQEPLSLARAAAPSAGALDSELWADARLYEHSPLSRRYRGTQARQVGFAPSR
ncbi:MAG TPA: zf-HC2 domain-containing protein [Longimicrobiales bacterium]|nr:zf-HC2 domain-containing protein [Longimicrobiales bacterium]